MNPTIQVGGVTIELTKEQLAQIDKQRMVAPIDPLSVNSYAKVCEILNVNPSDSAIKIVSSGFVFDCTICDATNATTSSASRLCLKDEATARHFGTCPDFKAIDEAIIDL